MKTVLSVDVAKGKSMFMLMNSDGEILIDAIEIKHNLENFNNLKKQVFFGPPDIGKTTIAKVIANTTDSY